jgi:hypothetical protein
MLIDFCFPQEKISLVKSEEKDKKQGDLSNDISREGPLRFFFSRFGLKDSEISPSSY